MVKHIHYGFVGDCFCIEHASCKMMRTQSLCLLYSRDSTTTHALSYMLPLRIHSHKHMHNHYQFLQALEIWRVWMNVLMKQWTLNWVLKKNLNYLIVMFIISWFLVFMCVVRCCITMCLQIVVFSLSLSLLLIS